MGVCCRAHRVMARGRKRFGELLLGQARASRRVWLRGRQPEPYPLDLAPCSLTSQGQSQGRGRRENSHH